MSNKNQTDTVDLNRRQFMGIAAVGALGAGFFGLSPFTQAEAKPLATNAKIVIIGAGAAGISLANRLARGTSGAQIQIIDSRERHLYQPGLTLIATGSWQRSSVVDSNARYIPKSVEWIKSDVTQVIPELNQVTLVSGQTLNYDYLLVASGLELAFDQIEGMTPDLIGQNGIGCVYDTPENAEGTWREINQFVQNGGSGIFTRAPGAIKCAGAPLKVAMLTEHLLREQGNRDAANMSYTSPGTGLFSQPDVDQFLKTSFPEREIDLHWQHRLVAIDADLKVASFATPDGVVKRDYDFIHVVPPMRAVKAVRESTLAWQDGDFSGWLEVDRHTLQHQRFSNVFGVGDCVGTPIGKTAATVKAQVPVAVQNLLRVLEGRVPDARFNGYTSCPLITERGQAMLVEFDYDLNMVPSFGFINPLKEQWVPWIMKDKMLRGAYNAMLRGRI